MVKLELVPTPPDAAGESLKFDRDAIEGVIAEACAWIRKEMIGRFSEPKGHCVQLVRTQCLGSAYTGRVVG